MTTDSGSFDPRRLTRRQLLKAGGLAAGALSLGRPALAQTPKPGGVLISAQNNEATGLDPQLVPAFSRSRRSPMMYNQLVRFDADMNPVPELAESWEVSKDGLAWTFKLRQGVKFHDGQEMTSADVKFTFDRLFEKSPGKSDFIAVDKVEPAGKYARQVHDQGAVRGDARGARRLLGLHHQRGGDQEARGSQQGGARHRALHARRLEGRAADGAEAPPELLQEGPALPRRGEPAHHPRRGQYRRGAPHRADPARVHRGQQELQPPEGREVADRLPQLAPRLRLPQHQRDAGAAQGRPRAPGDQLGGGPRPGHARGRRPASAGSPRPRRRP